MAGAVGVEPTLEVLETSVLPLNYAPKVGGGGRIRTAEPEGTDLQSVVFSHFTTPPIEDGAGERSRTLDLLITSQLLYQLSYTGMVLNNIMVAQDGIEPPTQGFSVLCSTD